MKSTKSLSFLLLSFSIISSYIPIAEPSSSIVKDVVTRGSCAIVGMTAEQSQLLALQRARAAAIEEAAGVEVTSISVVTDYRLAVDFIKTYSKGYIVKEKVEWLPLAQYQKDTSTPPIPEYRVKIIADVRVPKKEIESIGLEAKSNNFTFRNGESMKVEIKTIRKAQIAVFNIMSDDKIAMVFPYQYDNNIIEGGEKIEIPTGRVPFLVQTFPGHKRDTEALFVAATGIENDLINMFTPGVKMEFSKFFQKYSEIADYCEDVILPYEVVSE